MKHYGLKVAEGTEITNLTAPVGTSFPANENAGELFFRSDLLDLYIYDGVEWKVVLPEAVNGGTF